MHVTQNNLEDILRTEGFISGLGQIAENPYLADEEASDVYPQDLIDTVRIIVNKNLVQEGIRFLMSSEAVSVTYRIERKCDLLTVGRFFPSLQLEIVKSSISGSKRIFARLGYRKNPDYLTFAQFEIPTKFTELLKEVAYPEI